MELTRYVQDLQQRIAEAAELGGEEAQQLAARLTAPIDAAVRLVLIDALSVAAGEISTELAPGSVDVRMRGGEPDFVVTRPVPAEPGTPASPTPAPVGAPAGAPAAVVVPAPAPEEEGATTRTTLRLPDHLKTQVEAAAARDGVSVNTWIVRAVAAALVQPTVTAPPTPGVQTSISGATRITGWVH